MTDQTVTFDDAEAPRGQAGNREPTPLGRFLEDIRELRAAVEALQRGSQLRNASISGGEGLRILDADGTLQAQISPDRTVTIFDQAGEPVVRMGDMQMTGPQEYGIEVRVGTSWIQLGSQNVTWDNVGNKPSTFTPASHSHGGGDITSQVASAAAAATASQAALADGSQYGFNNPVGGTTFYQLWVGNDGGFHFGRNTSSQKYKQNIRKLPANRGVLDIELTLFDRKDQYRGPAEGIGPEQLLPGARNEYGAIAEQVAEVCPEVVQRFDGKIDGIRYEMIGLALVPVVREQAEEIANLRKQQEEQAQVILEINQRLAALGAPAAAPANGTTKGTTK